MIVAGVDPGISGAIAVVTDDDVQFVDMPTQLRERSSRREIDVPVLVSRLNSLGIKRATAVIEHLHARQGSAIQHQGQMMETAGAIRAAIAVAGWSRVVVDPKRWKKFYGLGSSKSASLDIARRLYPCASDELSRAKDHNRAEALLIAHWFIRTEGKHG